MHKKLIEVLFKKALLPGLILALAAAAYSSFYSTLESIFLKETLEYADKWIFTIFAVILAFLAQRIVGAAMDWYGVKIAPMTETTLDDEFLPLAKKLLYFFIWIIVVLMVLSRFGINTSGIIAALGVSSLAIALAAQDTISNIISGFLILVDRPFRIGDTIKIPSGEKVKVLTIGLRRSRFLSEDGAIIIVPNLALSKSKIVNYTYGEENKR